MNPHLGEPHPDSEIIFPIYITIEHWEVSNHKVIDLEGFQAFLRHYKGFTIGHADSDDSGWCIMGNFDLHRIQLNGRGRMDPVLNFLRNHLHHWSPPCIYTSLKMAPFANLATLQPKMTLSASGTESYK